MQALHAIQYVTGGLSLVAFIVAALYYAYLAKIKARYAVINSAPAHERIVAIDKTAEFLHFDTLHFNDKNKQEIVLKQLEIRAGRDRMIFVIALVVAILLASIALATILFYKPDSPIINANTSHVKVLTHPDVIGDGTMFKIKVTIIDSGNGSGRFNVDFFWSGVKGSWSGDQNAIFSLTDNDNTTLQAISVAINRSGCFYNGGNRQTEAGSLSFDPKLIKGLSVTLSEVHHKNEGAC